MITTISFNKARDCSTSNPFTQHQEVWRVKKSPRMDLKQTTAKIFSMCVVNFLILELDPGRVRKLHAEDVGLRTKYSPEQLWLFCLSHGGGSIPFSMIFPAYGSIGTPQHVRSQH
mmetsp:Transcript_5461/g.11112  ORF Transcript_5461/g.11112 Transcript_5461/m.11112 type:complete len:115 (-) Transcript_5461:125-469(-)